MEREKDTMEEMEIKAKKEEKNQSENANTW